MPECSITHTVVGSLLSTHIYRLRIELIIEKIANFDYGKENFEVFADYKDGCLPLVMALLQDIQGKALSIHAEEPLSKLTHTIMATQEHQIKANLNRQNYECPEEDPEILILQSIMSPTDFSYDAPGVDGGFRIEEVREYQWLTHSAVSDAKHVLVIANASYVIPGYATPLRYSLPGSGLHFGEASFVFGICDNQEHMGADGETASIPWWYECLPAVAKPK